MNSDEALSVLNPFFEDDRHSWSIGTFGATGEFQRESEEKLERFDGSGSLAMATQKGALRIAPQPGAELFAYDMINRDGQTWSQTASMCTEFRDDVPHTVTALGYDDESVQDAHRSHRLYDLGVGLGQVRFCIRTDDVQLIDTLDKITGQPLFNKDENTTQRVMTEFLRAQPHRVVISPIARIEVYQDIPPPDGTSPEGPHTHLLPRLLAKQRMHSANTPIPEGWQSVLNLHPQSPWRDKLGCRKAFDPEADREFEDLLVHHALPEDRHVRQNIENAVVSGTKPTEFDWPGTRRERIQARLTLRRLAARGLQDEVAPWRAIYDHLSEETDIINEETA